MEPMLFFAVVAAIIFLGFMGEFVFKRTNIPDVLWLMFFGIIIGHFFGFSQAGVLNELASIFTTFALIFILFEGALNLKIKEFFEGMYGGSLLSLVNFIASIAVSAIVLTLFGFGLTQSIVMGTILGGTSSAVVIPIVKRLNISKKASSSLTLESALSDVFCIVATLAIVEIYSFGSFTLNIFLNNILDKFLIAIAIGAVGGYIWLHILEKLSGHAKSYMITIAFMLLLYSGTEYLQSSGPMACLALGIMLGNSDLIFRLKNGHQEAVAAIKSSEMFFYSEISFLVKSFFFVYLGMIIKFTSPEPYIIAGALVAGFYLLRPVSTIIAGKGFAGNDRAVVDALVPKGLAAAVLAQLPAAAGIPGTELFADIVLAAVLISIIMSTVLVFLAEKGIFMGLSRTYLTLLGKKPVEEDPADPEAKSADEPAKNNGVSGKSKK
jgi:NhaP-type Na+/H+ or K+/H+ antiporter